MPEDQMLEDQHDELITHEGTTATFLYNPDLAGVVVIQDIQGNEVEVHGEDLVIFMAEAYVKPRLIKCIEKTPPEDLLLNQLETLN